MSWTEECERANALFEKGEYTAAATVFADLCERQDIPAEHKIIMAHNLAMTYDKLGQVDDALASYEFGASAVTNAFSWIQEMRASYLFNQNRITEALAIYELLLAIDVLPVDRKTALEHNRQIARARLQ